MREKISDNVLRVYLFVLTALSPVYMPHGYNGLGEDKARFFIVTGAVFAAVILIVSGTLPRADSLFPRAVLLSFLFETLTFVFAVDHAEAFFGTNGWRTGYLTQMICLFLALTFYSRFRTDTHTPFLLFAGPFIAIVPAVLQRSGLRVSFLTNDASFLSTIGNINWYGGFLAVFVPLAMVFFACPHKGSKALKVFLGVFIYVSALSLFTQGASAVWIPVCIGTICLFAFSLARRSRLRRAATEVFLFGAAAETITITRLFSPSMHPYDSAACLNKLLTYHPGLALMAAAALILLLLRTGRARGSEADLLFPRAERRLTAALMILIPVLTVLVLFAQFIVSLPPDFGNGRGVIYAISADLFKEGTFLRRLIGAGNDCYYVYSTSFPDISDRIFAAFGENRLTNAHSELLNLLITNGIAGVTAHLLLIAAFLRDTFTALYSPSPDEPAKADDPFGKALTRAALTAVLACLAYTTVSFRQVMITPYVYVLMGIAAGEKIKKSSGKVAQR